MIFWNIKLLKQRLIDEGLSQKHLFAYIFIFIMFIEVIGLVMFYMPFEGLNKYDYAQSIVDFITVGLGTFLLYRVNGGSEGDQFAERFISISFVVKVRFYFLFIPIFLIIYTRQYVAGDIELPATWYETIIYSFWLVVFYWRTIVHVKEVATSTSVTTS